VVGVDDVVADLELALPRPEILDLVDQGLRFRLLECYLCDIRLLK
jgi:hypothetical protein